ncbi:MAG TPA: hypothetical protein VMZ06_12405 [Candidatus Bathyarchaeia archaeon]|nr:hypothetical protein [Candidatus Bathyarchaeia archaeon]
MRNVGRVWLVAMIAAFGVILTGCPEEDDGGEDSWIRQTSYSEQGITVTDASIYKFYDDGRVTFALECTFSATDWSAQLRAWLTGTYTTAEGNRFLAFNQAACQDLAAKIMTRGTLSEQETENLAETLYGLQMILYLLTQQPPSSVSYSVEGDTMYLGGSLPYNRFDDSFNYADPTWISCPR